MAGLVESIADSIGATENAVTLLFSLLAGYPLGLVHRYLLYGKSPWIQHLFFIISGFTLGYWNFGVDVFHAAANVLLIYGLLLVCGGSQISIILAFIINMGYLHVGYIGKRVDGTWQTTSWTLPHCVLTLRLIGIVLDIYDGRKKFTYLCVGYYNVMSVVYTITWTTPQCVLTLRLIGLVYDIYDGHKKPEYLSAEQKVTAIRRIPSLLEVAGHTFFFGGFLVGPQFPIKRYLDFVDGAYFNKNATGFKPSCVTPALMRLAGGLIYTLVFQVGAIYFPDAYLLSIDFENSSLLTKCVVILLWGKITLYKYVACWLIAEGSCILTGLTYNGQDENGNDVWDACANISIRKYETATSCQQLIGAFNVNTNQWMSKYIFKRLKFLGNKDISQGATLFFLAIWHGLFSGYFMNFFLEFVIIKFERECGALIMRTPGIKDVVIQPAMQPAVWFIKKIYAQFALSYALVSFCLLSMDMWGQVYWQSCFIGHVVFAGWALTYPIMKKYLRPKRPRPEQNGTTESPAALKKDL